MAKGDNRPSWFKMFLHQKAIIDSVDDATAGKALKALFQYFATGEDIQLDQLSFVVFSAFKPCVDASFEEFRKLSEAGKAGNKKRWGENKSGGDTTRQPPITPDPEDRGKKIEERGEKKEDRGQKINGDQFHNANGFIPPTEEQVRLFCTEENLSKTDSRKFFNYYSANGWKMGNTPMADWRAAARLWNDREVEKQSPTADRKKPTLHDLFPPVPTL